MEHCVLLISRIQIIHSTELVTEKTYSKGAAPKGNDICERYPAIGNKHSARKSRNICAAKTVAYEEREREQYQGDPAI